MATASLLSSHHGHELVKVDGAGPVGVYLVDNLVQVVLGQGRVDLTEDLLQGRCRDVTVACKQCLGLLKIINGF